MFVPTVFFAAAAAALLVLMIILALAARKRENWKMVITIGASLGWLMVAAAGAFPLHVSADACLWSLAFAGGLAVLGGRYEMQALKALPARDECKPKEHSLGWPDGTQRTSPPSPAEWVALQSFLPTDKRQPMPGFTPHGYLTL